jgi:D-arabinonate dehydratase
MHVAEAVAQRVRIPLPAPVSHPVRTFEHREHLLVRVRTADGVEGLGCCLQDLSAAPALEAATELLFPMVLGRRLGELRAVWRDLYRGTVRAGRRGAVLHALSAVDIALWDALAKTAGLPLHELLGGARTSVPCYASGGYYHPGDGLEGLEREVAGYVEQGFRAVKMKIGRLGVRAERERVRVVREVLGDDRELFVDANQAYEAVDDAVALCRAIEPFDVGFFEEPFAVDDVEAFVRLRARTAIPLATGELESTRWGFHELVVRGAVDVVQPDVTVCGGITEFLQVAAQAAAAGIPVAPHYHWDLHLPLACAVPGVRILEKFEGTGVKALDHVLAEPYAVDGDGALHVRPVPGHGMAFDDAMVARYLVEERVLREDAVAGRSAEALLA